eukprot:gnl/Hemi2/4428_TR1556_c0_g2_i1.p1 gnl/Hemi2/4428_TR1556_c0_g2~~gnl/Hemi2/4428_TR1556_c0_g2_i1.p1  ORF type:complete len:341 (+),score=101.91 gnl/Hemi2/4428_TR1556_c0_g2_i1:41-1063(+)
MAVRWGIVGTGRIAQDFLNAMKTCPGAQAVAVGGSSQARALEFATEFSIPRSYGSYEEVIADSNVQVVYIATHANLHAQLTKQSSAAGKAVLCEKAFALNSRQVQSMIDTAAERQTFLMEGIWMHLFPLIIKLKEILKAGTIGDVRMVDANFGWAHDFSSSDQLLLKPECGGGSVLAVGPYLASFAIAVFGSRPTSVKAVGDVLPGGVDVHMQAVLKFGPNQTASLASSLLANAPGEARVIGTKGSIQVAFPFICPSKLVLNVNGEPSLTFESPPPANPAKFNFINSSGLAYEIEEVNRCVTAGLVESPAVPHAHSLDVMFTLDALRAQLGYALPADELA